MLYRTTDEHTRRDFQNAHKNCSEFYSYEEIAKFISNRALTVEDRDTIQQCKRKKDDD